MSNRPLFYVISVFLCFLAIQNVVLFVYIDRVTRPGVTALVPAANAELGFCINMAPVLNQSCNFTAVQDVPYSCTLGGSDPDNNNFTFSSIFLTSPWLFNVTEEGDIEFTPNRTSPGNHTVRIYIKDDSGCRNQEYFEDFNFQVINVNDAPILLMPFDNQTWMQDTSIAPYDLDLYFWDPDNDPLTFTWSVLNYIDVAKNSKNEIMFTPLESWTGIEYITFIAEDPYGANATSNDILLTVLSNAPPPQEQKPRAGGGGGSSFLPDCFPEWYCKQWGPCLPSGIQERTCTDLHSCNSSFMKPNTTQPCTFISTCYDGYKGPEEEDVDCGGVCPPCGSCYDGIKNPNEEGIDCGGPCIPCRSTVSCYDGVKNQDEEGIDCGGPCKPCKQEGETTPKKGKVPLFFYIVLGAVVLGGIAAILYVLYRRYGYLLLAFLKRKKKKSPYLLANQFRETILEKLAVLEKKIPKTGNDRLLTELSAICVEYFGDLFQINYQFTYEEMLRELKTRDIDAEFRGMLGKYFGKVTELSFSRTKGTKEDIKRLVSELRKIVIDTSIQEEAPATTATKAEKLAFESQKSFDSLLIKISDAEMLLETGKINEAYDTYIDILKEYNKLPDSAKQHAISFINLLYSSLKERRQKVA